MVSKNKYLIYFTVIIAVVVTQIYAACVCNEKGADYCAACSERRVVRPKPKYPSGIEIAPIGDTCSCNKMLIEPALPPKPYPKPKKPACACKASDAYAPPAYDALPSIFSAPLPAAPLSYALPPANYVPALPKDNSIPADPISVSLAIQAGKAIAVPEAKLSYGFVQKPLDGLPKVFISNVKEENLYALKNDVITLKKPAPAPVVEDLPEPEDEELNADAAAEDEVPPLLTYKQLGYVPEQFKNPLFQELPPVPAYAYAPPGYLPPAVVPGKVAVDCGFRPGRIAKLKNVKNYGDVGSCYAK